MENVWAQSTAKLLHKNALNALMDSLSLPPAVSITPTPAQYSPSKEFVLSANKAIP